MKCHGCGMSMIVDHTETEGHACTCWHRCPLCQKVRLVSQPKDPFDKQYASGSDTFSPEEMSADELLSDTPTRPLLV